MVIRRGPEIRSTNEVSPEKAINMEAVCGAGGRRVGTGGGMDKFDGVKQLHWRQKKPCVLLSDDTPLMYPHTCPLQQEGATI